MLLWALAKEDVAFCFKDFVFGREFSGWVLLKRVLSISWILELESPFLSELFFAQSFNFLFDVGFKNVMKTVKANFFLLEQTQ